MLKIDGVVMPTPATYSWGIQDLSKAERNARGTMIIERIATKRKLELSWKYLDRAQLQQLLAAVSPIFFTLEYPDPQTDTVNTGMFYVGDRKVGALDYKNSQVRWVDCQFNVIER